CVGEAVGAEGESLLAGRYRLLDRLGSGGTGTVYRAQDLITAETVAVKILNPHTTSAALRHRREVLALRALQIPGVVRLIDEGRSEGRPFLAMEYLPGEPFPGSTRRTWKDIAAPTIALLETLARVHAAGVVHRDLKPANVLVDDTGRPVLLDFGLARGERLGEAVTRPDSVVGTPRYQAPEQLAGQSVDARTDLYALGLMLYEALAGRPPHPLDSIGALASARLYRDAPPLQYAAPDAPPDVCRVVDRLLARLPEARPGSAAEVIEALRGVAGASDRPPLPWLGPDTPVRLALDALHAQRPFVIRGAPGSGRTRCLQEIAEALARQGRRSAWTRSGARPFESVAPIVGQADTLDGDAPPAADPAVIARQLLGRL
ncbi:MAG: serine/threonine-protein kinase, partial [Myxococcota bacterium]